jgi:hypothetical protein
MKVGEALQSLNQLLEERQPKTFSCSWILTNAPNIYQCIWKKVKTENGDVDWDSVTSALDRTFQRRFVRYRKRLVKPYENASEVEVIMTKNKDRLYALFAPLNERDKAVQHRLIISLVRVGQKGNVCAQDELIKWVTFITNDWLDRYPQMLRWKGYEDEVGDKIRHCIRCYRYTGSFLGYLFKTLEYSARGKPPLCSLDDKVLGGAKTLAEYVTIEEELQS